MPTDAVANLLATSPELINTPGLAADALNGAAAPDAAGPTLSLASTVDQVQQHAKKSGGFWTNAFNTIGDVLNAPVQGIQHQYKFIHDTFERHGALEGIGVLLPGLALGTLGAFAGPEGALAGFELGTEGVGQLANTGALGGGLQKSWKDTTSQTYRDAAGHLENAGQDMADIVNHVLGGGNYTPAAPGHTDVATGIGNAIFDLTLDPLMVAGKLANAFKAAKFGVDGAKGAKNYAKLDEAGKPIFDDAGKVVPARPGIADTSMPADRVLEIYNQQPRVRQMTDVLAKSSTADILTNFPKLQLLASDLGKATSHDDVLNVFRDALTSQNYSALSGGLPRTGITGRAIQARTQVKNAILDAGSKVVTDASGNPVTSGVEGLEDMQLESSNKLIRAFTSHRPHNVADDRSSLSGSSMNPADDSSVKTLGQVLRVSQNPRTANMIQATYADTKDVSERVNIYAHAIVDMARAFGMRDDHPFLTRWLADHQQMLDSTANKATYGLNWNGERITQEAADGQEMNSALLLNQQGKVFIPNFNEMRQALREDKNLFTRVAGNADDWVYDHLTKYFKKFALQTGGFALRVAAGELLPATLKYGGKVAQGGLASAALKFNPSLGGLVNDATDEQVGKLVGLRVSREDLPPKGSLYGEDASGYGRIQSVDAKAGTADVQFGNKVETHPLENLNAYHNDVSEKDIRLIARNAGLSFDRSEVGNIRAAASKALYGVSRALMDPDFVEQGYLNILTNGAGTCPSALLADHGHSRVMAGPNTINQSLKQVNKSLPLHMRLGTDFTTFDGTADLHEMYWNHALHEAAKDPSMVAGARAYHDAMTSGASADEAKAAFVAADKPVVAATPEYAQKITGAKVDPHQFSTKRAELFQGLTHSQMTNLAGEHKYHDFVGEALANGDAPTIRALSNVDVLDRPYVKGRVLDYVHPESAMDKVASYGFRKAIQPTINFLAREPIFTTATTMEYKNLKPFVEAGFMDKVSANMIAQQRAVHQVMPLIHNTELRSQFSELARNFMPFYYAQEQAYRRYGTQILKDPVSFERYHLAVHGINSSGVIQQDGAGQSYLVLPFASGITDKIVQGFAGFGYGVQGGVPSVVSGNVSSLRSVVPGGLVGTTEMPGASPLVAISLKDIQNLFPSTEPIISKAIGSIGENQSLVDSLIPNTFVRNIIKATPAGDNTASSMMAVAYTLANAKRRSDELRAQGKIDEANKLFPDATADEATVQTAIDRARHTTRVMIGVRAVFSLFSPLAPKLDVGDTVFRKEVLDSIKAANGDPNVGIQNFLDKHPDATPDTVFLSNAKYLGTNVPAGDEALKWVKDNRGFIDKNHLAAAYLMPQGGAYNQEAYNLEMAVGLRQRKTPMEFVNSLYAAAGNAKYYPALKAKNDMIAAQPDRAAELNTMFNKYTQFLGNANPIWYADLKDPNKAKNAHDTMLQLRQVVDSGKAPASPMLTHVSALIGAFDGYEQARTNLTTTGGSTSQLHKNWSDFLDFYAKQHPEATTLINGVFRRLPVYEQYAQAQSDAAGGAPTG